MNNESSKQSLTILFADIGGSTKLYEQVGDVEAHRLVAESLGLMESAIVKNGGTLLRTVGDAALASFKCCDDAFEASVAIQELHINSDLSVRIGFHHGSVIPDKGDVYGNAVNIAARVASVANLNEITTTEESVKLMCKSLQQRAALLDFINVKGIADPLPVYRLFWHPEDEGVTAIQTAVSLSFRNPSNVTLKLSWRDQNTTMGIDNPSVTIGRVDENSLTVINDCVSRFHASIDFVQGKFILKDQSTNGTYILKENQAAVFLRRESMTIDSSGVIGAGWMPEPDDPDVIHFTYNSL